MKKISGRLKSVSSKDITQKKLSPKLLKLMGLIDLKSNFNYKKELGKALYKRFNTSGGNYKTNS